MKYRSPDLDKMSRDEIIEAIEELDEFGVCLKPVSYSNIESYMLLTILQFLQDSYKTAKATVYNVFIGDGISSIYILSIPDLDKIYCQNIDEFSNTSNWKNEHILLTNDWVEMPDAIYQSFMENECLVVHKEFSDETFDYVSEFTVHYRLEDLQSR